jgi:Lrp/AsnC family transcriptional regulator for asnA, asnC and gidA
MQLDDIDTKIIKILEQNGRITNKKISQNLKISEGTVRNRINRLIEHNHLKVKGLVNPENDEKKVLVYVMIKLAGNRDSMEVAKAVAQLKPINSVSIIAGRFDLLAEIYIETHKLIEFLNRELSKIPSVLTVESLITLKNFYKWI